MKIKAMTLWQPWATLVAIGEKQYETRSWRTNHRGLLAIHAAKRKARAEELSSWILGTLQRNGQPLRWLPYGKVVCIMRLVDVVPTETVIERAKYDHRLRSDELEFGDYSPGRYAWKLERILPVSIPARGHQGLWTWEVPGKVAEVLTVRKHE